VCLTVSYHKYGAINYVKQHEKRAKHLRQSKLRRAGRVARMYKMTALCKFLLGRPQGKVPSGKETFKCILQKFKFRVCTDFKLLQIETNGYFFNTAMNPQVV
jgi:hypothetical protein